MKEKFPEEYSILLYGPPGVGKRAFCLDLANYYLQKGRGVVYIITERTPKDIEASALSAGIDLSKHKVFYIDYASWSVAEKSGWLDAEKRILTITNPTNLRDITLGMKVIDKAIGGHLKVIVDSLSPLFLYNTGKKITQFVQMLTSRIKADNGFVIYTLQEGIHPPSIVNTLIYVVDGYLQMRFLEEGGVLRRQVRTHHLQGLSFDPEWQDFGIEKGFSFKSDK